MNAFIRVERTRGLGRMLLVTAAFAAASLAPIVHLHADGNRAYPTTSEGLVEQAEQAAIDGDMARRFALLREAVRIDPQFQLARWQLGQVQVDGEWLTVEEAQRRTSADPKQADYRRLRSEIGNSQADQIALARWCRKNGLDEESRFHWASVLSLQPGHREALRALGVRWIDGELMTRQNLDATKQQRFAARSAARKWQSQLARWQRALALNANSNRQQTLDQIRAIDDPAAIPTVERVTLVGDSTDGKRSAWRGEMGLAFVTALEGIRDHAATESLARHAVLSPFADVRHSAAERLRYRPLHDFVPELLDALATQVESTFRVDTDADGSVRYVHTLYREGSHTDWSSQRSRTAMQSAIPQRVLARLAGDVELPDLAAEAQLAARAAASAARATSGYAREAAAVEEEVAAINRATAALNERIVDVLA
ncbi:MAG TPA: hypothetical protein VGK58_01315, partial [Lacipirellulaceae bacterium]